MKKYKIRPTQPFYVEAVRWDESKKTIIEIGCVPTSMYGTRFEPDLCRDLKIKTVNGRNDVLAGWYIAKNPNGTFQIASPSEFNRRFQRIL